MDKRVKRAVRAIHQLQEMPDVHRQDREKDRVFKTAFWHSHSSCKVVFFFSYVIYDVMPFLFPPQDLPLLEFKKKVNSFLDKCPYPAHLIGMCTYRMYLHGPLSFQEEKLPFHVLTGKSCV